MSELKPCPVCGQELCTYQSSHGTWVVVHTLDKLKCPVHFVGTYYTEESAIADANRRAQPANEPLTLEQLKVGDVVWIKDLAMEEIECLRFDRIEPATYHSGDDYRFEQFGTRTGIIRWACKYGIYWLAYRRPPERSAHGQA